MNVIGNEIWMTVCSFLNACMISRLSRCVPFIQILWGTPEAQRWPRTTTSLPVQVWIFVVVCLLVISLLSITHICIFKNTLLVDYSTVNTDSWYFGARAVFLASLKHSIYCSNQRSWIVFRLSLPHRPNTWSLLPTETYKHACGWRFIILYFKRLEVFLFPPVESGCFLSFMTQLLSHKVPAKPLLHGLIHPSLLGMWALNITITDYTTSIFKAAFHIRLWQRCC